MSNKIYFKYNPDVLDVIPFLWDPDKKDPPSEAQLVSSKEDFDTLVRFGMGGSSRSRTISIVTGLETAKAIAYQAEANESAVSIITEIGDDIYSVGSTSFDGSYDDGIPLIAILTEDEIDCNLDHTVPQMTEILESHADRAYEPELLTSEEVECAM